MNAVSLINQLAASDIRLWLDQGQLRYSAPDGAMTPELISLLRQHKAALMEFLQQSDNSNLQIPSADYSQPLPVSFAQQRLWFMQKLEPANSAFHIHTALRIRGNLNVALLQQACLHIIERHAVLRSFYYQQDGQLYQQIEPHSNWQVTQQHINACDLDQVIRSELHRPFDLSAPLPLRCTVFHLDDTDYVASFTVHHIAADGWSLGIFVQELISNYQALAQQQTPSLAPLACQYADFAAWQTSAARQQTLQQQLQYWQQQLAGVPTLDLPLSHMRSAHTDNRAAVVQRSIAAAPLQALNKRYNSTLFVSMMALLSTLLHRYSQQSDFCIGTPVAGRPASALEALIGCFINVLAIRCEPQATQLFSEYLLTIKARCTEALSHQDIPFEQVVQALDIARDLSITPLFQTMLSVQNTPFSHSQVAGLSIEPVTDTEVTAQFDLKLTVQEQGDELLLAFEYKKALFNDALMDQMADHFVALCAAACAQPEQSLAQLALLSNAERQRLLGQTAGGFNDTQVALSEPLLLHQAFEAQAAQHPDAPALICGEQRLSYQQLNQQANQLAHTLIARGAGRGTLIAVCLNRSPSLMISLLAIMKSGAAYVPLDPELPAGRIHHILQDSQALLTITAEPLRHLFTAQHTLLLPDTDDISSNTLNPANTVSAEDLVYVLYTSGSTGTPKGVMIEHMGLANYLQFACRQYMPQVSASVVSSTISFDATITTLYSPLLCGKPVIFTDAADTEFTELAQRIFHSTENYLFKLTPAHLDFLHSRNPQVAATTQQHVFVIGGEQLLTHQLNKWLQQLAPASTYVNEYGPTETVVGCCILTLDQQHLPRADRAAVPIGRPISNTRLYVLDSLGQPVPAGIPGELYIAGSGVARGYLNLAQRTADSFLPDIFASDGSRFYRTGDKVRQLENGDLEYLGRLDQQVKIRGQRLELEEIEAILQSFTGISSAIADVRSHGDDKRLVAWYLANHSIDEQALRQHLASRLPAYMIPSALVAISAWPLSPNGKISRNRLPSPDWQSLNRKPYVAPQTDSEQRLAAIWQSVLKTDNIGIHDNFFELGGHSLTAAQALGLAQQEFGQELPLRQLFENPSIAAIAALLDQGKLEQQILSQDAVDEDSESFVL